LDWHQIDRITASLLLSTMQPGKLLCDRYRVEKELAAGGFGQTFLAIDTHLPSKPQVVVKLLKPAQNDPATLQIAQRLFNTEAETLERLGKDNDRIPSLYAYFPLHGEFYLVQEYIAGTTLTDELQKRKMSESDTLAILHEILTGLTKVHSQNIIHRDLKPDNIIRGKIDRKLVLIDFGAVKQIRAASANTPNTIISQTICIGTPGYMPSEQFMGSPKLASDIYAVGAIAVQCLTGSHPYSLFDKDTLQLKWQHLCRVNRDVATVIDRMIAPNYPQRYANATEALQAIASLISPVIRQEVKPPAQPKLPTPPATSNRQKFQFETAKLEIATRKAGLFGWGEEKEEKITRRSDEAEYFSEDLGNFVKLDMVYVPAGSFLMGQAETETQYLIELCGKNNYENGYIKELPYHQVSLSGFYMGKYPITQQHYQAIMGKNPSAFKGDNRPVEGVNWLNAMEFCQKLSQRTGKQYTLPSESQWEYACRAGTTTPFYYGETISTDLANYDGYHHYATGTKGKERNQTTDVHSFPANAWGLYDMHGNVREWCLDEWVGNYNGAPTDGNARGDIYSQDKNIRRLQRGGAHNDPPWQCRSAHRFSHSADLSGYAAFGFRVVVSQNS
jgi:eukaryotic-like serine/threonine-protein kinase